MPPARSAVGGCPADPPGNADEGAVRMLIDLEMDGPLATVTLNRPEKYNALTLEMRVRLAEVCERVTTRR